MTTEKGPSRYVWLLPVILALVLIAFGLMCLSAPIDLLDYGLQMSASSVTLESLDQGAIGTVNFITSSMCLGGIWLGILGLFCAWGLKRKESFAWKLGLLWSLLVIADGAFRAVTELFVLGWSTVSPCVYPYILGGLILIVCLLAVRKKFS